MAEQGRKALKEGEVPVGCVIARRPKINDSDASTEAEEADEVIATGYNKTNERRDVRTIVVIFEAVIDRVHLTMYRQPCTLKWWRSIRLCISFKRSQTKILDLYRHAGVRAWLLSAVVSAWAHLKR